MAHHLTCFKLCIYDWFQESAHFSQNYILYKGYTILRFVNSKWQENYVENTLNGGYKHTATELYKQRDYMKQFSHTGASYMFETIQSHFSLRQGLRPNNRSLKITRSMHIRGKEERNLNGHIITVHKIGNSTVTRIEKRMTNSKVKALPKSGLKAWLWCFLFRSDNPPCIDQFRMLQHSRA